MQNLFRLSILTITLYCANYFSTYAQEEQKAFKEGDKVLSIGISGGYSSSRHSKLIPSISFDYGLKGTRGIVSLGGFVGYSTNTYGLGTSTSLPFYNPPFPKDSVNYSVLTANGLTSHTFIAGLRFGLHYSTRKWDLYAGALIGYRLFLTESRTETTEYYKGILSENGNFTQVNGTLLSTETVNTPNYSIGQMVFSPYVGARYYLTQKISLNLEVGQHTGNIGVGFKL